MLFSPSWLTPSGPPPQAVLDKRPLWQFLMFLLVATTLMRFITLDIIGGVLSGLMLCMVCMVTSDGMAELSRYALVFGMLSILCLFFDAVPLLASLDGRSDVSIEPVAQEQVGGNMQITYTTTVKTTPFFDSSQGFEYNANSFTMILSPVTMLLGACLGIHAHVEIQNTSPPTFDNEGDAAWWTDGIPLARSSSQGEPGAEGRLRAVARFQGVARRLEDVPDGPRKDAVEPTAVPFTASGAAPVRLPPSPIQATTAPKASVP